MKGGKTLTKWASVKATCKGCDFSVASGSAAEVAVLRRAAQRHHAETGHTLALVEQRERVLTGAFDDAENAALLRESGGVVDDVGESHGDARD